MWTVWPLCCLQGIWDAGDNQPMAPQAAVDVDIKVESCWPLCLHDKVMAGVDS